jgi:predicted alpha/beta-fold hydrolase
LGVGYWGVGDCELAILGVGSWELGFEMSRFTPLVNGGHKQTLYAWARPRRFPRLPAPSVRYFDVSPDARVLAHCHWQNQPSEHPTFLLLHGLEGSSLAHYICGISDKAWAAGWNVVRLNQRNCGNTEHLSRGLYHSGLTHDPLHVLRELIDVDHLPAIVIAGYSLGGNLALKLAGELSEGAPAQLTAVCAVSPTMELAICVDALERKSNVLYEWNFVRNLRARMKRKSVAWPEAFDLTPLRGVRTVRQFDEVFTAPHHGFRDATDYYHRASAMRVIDRIRVPALIVTAEDDPFVPAAPFREAAVTANPYLTVIITPTGGHCAYVERAEPGYDGYWAEREIVRFAAAHTIRDSRFLILDSRIE